MSQRHERSPSQREPTESSVEETILELLSSAGATNVKFVEILTELSENIGQTPPALSVLTPFEPVLFEAIIEDVELRISFTPGDDDFAYLACVFGPLPERCALQAATKLLEINLFLHTHGASTFCLDADSQDVICACRLNIDMLSASSLFDTMTILSKQAQRWRSGWFISDDSASGLSPLSLFA
jgi:hypothetical protein